MNLKEFKGLKFTCHFPSWSSVSSWKPHVMCNFDHLFPCHLSIKLKNTCPLGRRITPMSCVKKNIAKSIHKSHVMYSRQYNDMYIYIYIFDILGHQTSIKCPTFKGYKMHILCQKLGTLYAWDPPRTNTKSSITCNNHP